MMNQFRTPESQFPALATGEVHAWRVNLRVEPDQLARLFETLAEEEQARAKRFVFERDAGRYIVAHSTLRYLLSNYTAVKGTDIQIFAGKRGKPYIRLVNKSSTLHFNLSHSGDLAVMAFCSDGELGIDIEQKRDEAASVDIAERHFSVRELAELKNLSAVDGVAGFFRCWTRKEAYVKAKGAGLGFDLRTFDVSLDHDEVVQLRAKDAEKWKVFSFTSEPDYWGALVYPSSVRALRLWSLAPEAIP